MDSNFPYYNLFILLQDCCTGNAGRENNSGDDCIENEDEAYVHEAFLADWRPSTSIVASELPFSKSGEKDAPSYLLPQEGFRVREQADTSGSGNPQTLIGDDTHNTSSVNLNHPVSHNLPSSSFKSQFWRPYRSRRSKSSRLVKLAPDLPPVNLPPSVRVMSQSAFKSYQGGASGKASGADNGLVGPTKKYIVPKLPCVASSVPVKAGQDKADLQMHPLLFQSPEDGHLPYYPLNCSTTSASSSSSNFFSRNQPQLNLNLFLNNPQQANHLLNFLDKSSKVGSTSSFDINFHPLLQRNDDVNTELVTSDSALRSHCAQSHIPINNSSITTSAIPPSPNAKTNELDLEIHLSFTSGKRKAGLARDVTQNNIMYSTVSGRDSETIETENVTNSLVTSSNDVNRNSVNDIGDQSFPEIVMEQEELSDSEEEIGEHVEFECEEMADSDGEEASDTEHFRSIQNKVPLT